MTLLELVIVLAVLAVLVTTAVSSYEQYVERAYRAEAIRLMLSAADCQERVRMESGFYDTNRCLDVAASESHVLVIEPADTPETLDFTVIARLREGREDPCGDLALNQSGTRAVSAAGQNVARCWGGR